MDMKAMGSQIRHSATNGQRFLQDPLGTGLTYPKLSSALLETWGFASANLGAVRQTWLIWQLLSRRIGRWLCDSAVECGSCCNFWKWWRFGEEVRGVEIRAGDHVEVISCVYCSVLKRSTKRMGEGWLQSAIVLRRSKYRELCT